MCQRPLFVPLVTLVLIFGCLVAQLDSSTSIASSSTTSSSHFAHTGILANALSASSSSPWIINSSATDHMTGSSSLLYFYISCSSKDKDWVVDGSLSSVLGRDLFTALPLFLCPLFFMFLNFPTYKSFRNWAQGE